ncbi:MAG: sugar nucleotide-binding protein [Lachnospiraceae bacterium]|nr:sugar nucleotide-binding protein [Lachnospiraceae bacterium]MDE6982313.1 sugar nucleotide-binding protein [Lachnospiraceae bacterium]
MKKRILLLGATGTVGTAIHRQISLEKDWEIWGTYCSSKQKDTSSMLRFSVEHPDIIPSVLNQVRPDIVISSLRGDFDRQLFVHESIADYLSANHGKIIYISTANVFDGSCEKPHYEDDTRNSDSDYGRFKIQCEDLLKNRLGSHAVILRIPFVWGKNSPRVQEIKAGCEKGTLKVYTEFFSNHAADLQIAQTVRWIIETDQEGTFHVGTSDVIDYQEFIKQLIPVLGEKEPCFVYQKEPGVMAVLSSRKDIPDSLKWNSEKLIAYLK